MDKIAELINKIDFLSKLKVKYELVNLFDDKLCSYIPYNAIVLGVSVSLVIVILYLIGKICFPRRKVSFFIGYAHPVKQKVWYGKTINYPNIDVPEGYEFLGWYKEKECINVYKSTRFKERRNLNLFAKFEDINKLHQ